MPPRVIAAEPTAVAAATFAERAELPTRAETRFVNAMYCGSRSLKSTSNGVAMKIDE